MKNQVNNLDWEEGIKYIPSKSIDLVVSDPPYGINYNPSARKVNPHAKIINDDNLDWLPKWIHELLRVSKKDAHWYIFCSWHNVDIFKSTIDKQAKVKNILVWDKGGRGLGDLEGNYSPSYELILFVSLGAKKLKGKRDKSILRQARTGNYWHPTQKPVSLIRYLIEKSSEEGDTVLDTFAGSHSTAIACRQCNRNFITFEIDKSYCAIAERLLKGVTKSLFSIYK